MKRRQIQNRKELKQILLNHIKTGDISLSVFKSSKYDLDSEQERVYYIYDDHIVIREDGIWHKGGLFNKAIVIHLNNSSDKVFFKQKNNAKTYNKYIKALFEKVERQEL